MEETARKATTEEEDRELIRRGSRAYGKRMLNELLLVLCGVLILLGFGVAHASGIQGPLHHPGIIVGVAGLVGAAVGGWTWFAQSPRWLVDEVLGRAVEHELELRGEAIAEHP